MGDPSKNSSLKKNYEIVVRAHWIRAVITGAKPQVNMAADLQLIIDEASTTS